MPTEVAMPRLGWDMQVGSVAEWLKRDGERVTVGEPIAMIAADKGTVELEAPDSGILRISSLSPKAGVEVPVGTLLGYVLNADEEIPVSLNAAAELPGALNAAAEVAAMPEAAPSGAGVPVNV